MPITLGCPSCGKRFRARDESAGKRVKCPFCQAAVPVPSADEAHRAAARTDVNPPVPASDAYPAPPARPAPAPAASWEPRPAPPVSPPIPVPGPAAWGAGDPPAPHAFLDDDPAPAPARPAAPVGKKGVPPVPVAAAKPPVDRSLSGWRKARGGLGWVSFALFWFAILGALPFAKFMYERAGQQLPSGEGWVKIQGYVNSTDREGIQLDKRDEIHVLAYGVPALIGGLALVLGRVTCGAVPRSSGAKGMFALSGFFTLVALAGVVTVVVAYTMGLNETLHYALPGVVVVALLAEVWFLTGLGVAGAALQQPKAARAVGFVVLLAGVFAGLSVAAAGHEWEVMNVGRKTLATPQVPAAKEPTPAPKTPVAPAPGRGKKGAPVPQANVPDGATQFVIQKDTSSTSKGKPKARPKATEPKKTEVKKEEAGAKVDEPKTPAKSDFARPDDYTVQVRHKVVNPEFRMYELGGGGAAWLLLILAYWRAVRVTRRAIRDRLNAAPLPA